MAEEERLGEEIRDYISIPPLEHNKDYHDKFEHHFKLALQASPHVIQDRIHCSGKYPDQNLAKNMQERHTINFLFFLFVDHVYICCLDIVEGVESIIQFTNTNALKTFTRFCEKEDGVIISNTSIIIDSDEEGDGDDDDDDNSEHFNENITRKLVIAKKRATHTSTCCN